MIGLKLSSDNQMTFQGQKPKSLLIRQNQYIVFCAPNMFCGDILKLPNIQCYSINEAYEVLTRKWRFIDDPSIEFEEFIKEEGTIVPIDLSLVETTYLLDLITLNPADGVNHISGGKLNPDNYLYDMSEAYGNTFERLGGRKGLKFRFIGNHNYQFTWRLSDNKVAMSTDKRYTFEQFVSQLIVGINNIDVEGIVNNIDFSEL